MAGGWSIFAAIISANSIAAKTGDREAAAQLSGRPLSFIPSLYNESLRMIRPDFKEFSRLRRTATLVPVAKSLPAALLTPGSALLAVAEGEPDAFLLESVDRGEKIGRYTFLGVRPF